MKITITLLCVFICSFVWTQTIYQLPSYDYISTFRAGFAYVKLNEKAGLIDTNFQEVIPLEFDYIDSYDGWPFVFNDTIFAVKNEKTFLFNSKGVLIDSLDKVQTPDQLHNWAKRGRKVWELTSYSKSENWWSDFGCELNGTTIIPFNYRGVFEGLADDQILAYKKDSIHVYTVEGHLTDAFPRSSFTVNDIDQLYTVSRDGKIEMTDKHFKTIKQLKVDRVYSNHGQYYSVEKQGKVGIIDQKQRTVLPFEYDEIYLSNYHFMH